MESFGSTASHNISALCDHAVTRAARETGVPVSVLQAISINESGRRQNGQILPWPWTVNMEGSGRWFETREDALRYVYDHYERGVRSFDISCFQINYRWHGHHFESIEAMFDPYENALYAARFLSDLYSEKGNWSDAAGAYHSRTPQYANRYKARFDEALANISKEVGQTTTRRVPGTSEPAEPDGDFRENLYPLLRSGTGRQSLGSLVSLEGAGPAHRLIDSTH